MNESAVPIYKTWKALQIALLLMCVVDEIVEQQLKGGTFAGSLPLTLAFVCVGLLLNAFRPDKLKPYWLRFMVPFIEIVMAVGIFNFGGLRYVGILYPAIVGKSSTFLDTKSWLGVIALSFLAQLFSMWLRFHGMQEFVSRWDLSGFNLIVFMLTRSGGVLAAIFFSAWLSMSLLKERETRIRAEQLAEQVEVFAKKVERTRIARDIHDTLGHTLTSLNIQLDLARIPRRNVPTDVLEIINTSKQLAEQSADDLRNAIYMLRGSEFDLKSNLEALVARCSRQSDLKIELNISNLPAIEQQLSNHLYLLVLEIITNARKHAEATQLSIQLAVEAGNIILIGTDNGKGFDTSAVAAGFGLQGMRERVVSMHGNLEIETTPARSTSIKASIPLSI